MEWAAAHLRARGVARDVSARANRMRFARRASTGLFGARVRWGESVSWGDRLFRMIYWGLCIFCFPRSSEVWGRFGNIGLVAVVMKTNVCSFFLLWAERFRDALLGIFNRYYRNFGGGGLELL